MLVSGSIDIEEDGSVSGFVIEQRDELPPALANLIDKTLPAWRFEPILLDGRSVKANARMTLRLVAEERGDGDFVAKIGSASFGADDDEESTRLRREHLEKPRYPLQAISKGVEGTVYVLLQVGRSGKVQNAFVEQVNLRGRGKPSEMEKYRRMLAQSALRAAAKWTFLTPTSGDEVDEEFWSVRVPIDYQFTDTPTSDRAGWDVYVPGPRARAPWLQEDMPDTGVDAIAGDAFQQLGKGPRLLTPLGPDGG